MLKLLFIGDPHFGRNPSFLKPGAWRQHVVTMLDAALAAAVRANVDAIVILGDTFDHNNPHPKDHAEFTDWLHRAQEAGQKVISIPGNHDYEDADSNALAPYERMRGLAKIINKVTVTKMKGVAVRFYPWSPPDVQHAIGDIQEKTPYLIIHHEEVKGAKMDNGWPADGFVPRKKDYLVGGHLHTWQRVGKNAIYPGTALVHHYNHNTKGFLILKARMVDGKLDVQTAQAPFVPPFFMQELALEDYLKVANKEHREVYYKIHAPVGTDLPDDKRIINRKFIGEDPKKKKTVQKAGLASLPDPVVWFVKHSFPKEKRGSVMRILDGLKVDEALHG